MGVGRNPSPSAAAAALIGSTSRWDKTWEEGPDNTRRGKKRMGGKGAKIMEYGIRCYKVGAVFEDE